MNFWDISPLEWFILVIGFVLPLLLFIVYIVIDQVENYIWRKRKPKLVESELLRPPRDYDQEMTDILKEAEKMRKELPLVTLWWGLDGLQINGDRTLEWISKKPKEPEPYSGFLCPPPIPEYPIGGYLQMPTPWSALQMRYGIYGPEPVSYQGLSPINGVISYESGMSVENLRNQLNVLQWQEFQNYQTRVILDSLNHYSQEKHTL